MFTNAQRAIIDEALHIIRTAREPYSITRKAFHSASVARDYAYLQMVDLEREEFRVSFLTSQHELLDTITISLGTIDQAAVYPREIVKAGLACNAAAVILMHNHPSGKCDPSESDKQITTIINDACKLVDIRTLDHLIVGDYEVYSFAENGLL